MILVHSNCDEMAKCYTSPTFLQWLQVLSKYSPSISDYLKELCLERVRMTSVLKIIERFISQTIWSVIPCGNAL